LFWTDWAKLEKRVETLEKENNVLKFILNNVLETLAQDDKDIQKLDLNIQELLCAYNRHLYQNYHGVKTMDGRIVLEKPNITLEGEMELCRIEQTLRERRKELY